MEITEDALFARLGRQTVELELLRQQVAAQKAVILRQAEQLKANGPSGDDPPVDQMNRISQACKSGNGRFSD